MKTKTNSIILALFVLIFFSACYKKVDNTSLNENYKILNQVSIVAVYKDIRPVVDNPFGVFRSCSKIGYDFWFNSIIDTHKFSEILENNKGIEVLDFGEPVKRLIVIKPISYHLIEKISCSANIFVDVFLYDIEGIYLNWAIKSYEDIIKEINLLEDKNLIYTNRYKLDENFNTIEVLELDYGFNKTDDRDVKKFFNKIVEDLEKVVKFPYSLNP